MFFRAPGLRYSPLLQQSHSIDILSSFPGLILEGGITREGVYIGDCTSTMSNWLTNSTRTEISLQARALFNLIQ